MRSTKKKRKILIPVIVVGAIAAIFFIYVGTYSRALPQAQAVAEQMEEVDGGLYFYGSGNEGIIIYPGGKVAGKAYAPLAQMLNEGGYTVAIVSVPFHLAIFDPNVAQKVLDNNPDIGEWVIAGHSLGGTAASMFVHDNPEKVMGIAFLGSYPYKDLSGLDIFGLYIDGSNDEVLDHDKAEEALPYYPADSAFEIIEGGNHAGFGCYGGQSGDGPAGISWEEQNRDTADLILEAMAAWQ